MVKRKNIFYFKKITSIGGVETFFYYMARKYADYDNTIYYSEADPEQLRRLKKYIRTKKFSGEDIECEKVFFNYNRDIIEHVKAKEYIEIIHTDYVKQGLRFIPDSRITKYIGVTKYICESFTKATGLTCELCYNPLFIEEPKRVLKLISTTRLTKEKGKDRIIKLANMLDAAEIPFLWLVFTNDTHEINNPNVIYMQQRLYGLQNYVAEADYLVQLSDDGERLSDLLQLRLSLLELQFL